MALGEHALTISHVLDVRNRKQDLTIDAQPFFFLLLFASVSLSLPFPNLLDCGSLEEMTILKLGPALICFVKRKHQEPLKWTHHQDNLTLK